MRILKIGVHKTTLSECVTEDNSFLLLHTNEKVTEDRYRPSSRNILFQIQDDDETP
jgi:hypothetical protein